LAAEMARMPEPQPISRREGETDFPVVLPLERTLALPGDPIPYAIALMV